MIETINQFLAPVEGFVRTQRKWISYLMLAVAYGSVLTYFNTDLQKDLGGISYWLLFIILALPPLSRVTGIKLITLFMGFRRELGILMGMTALMHYTLFVVMMGWLAEVFTGEIYPWFIAGMLALFPTLILLITSNNASMKFLGKWWKRVHKAVYLIVIFGVAHVLLLSPARMDYLVPVVLFAIIKIADLAWLKLHARNS